MKFNFARAISEIPNLELFANWFDSELMDLLTKMIEIYWFHTCTYKQDHTCTLGGVLSAYKTPSAISIGSNIGKAILPDSIDCRTSLGIISVLTPPGLRLWKLEY